MTTLQKVLTS